MSARQALQPGVVPPAAGSALLIGALSVTGSLLVGAVIAWHLGVLDFNPSREPRSSRGSSGSGGTPSFRRTLQGPSHHVMQRWPGMPALELPRLQCLPAAV